MSELLDSNFIENCYSAKATIEAAQISYKGSLISACIQSASVVIGGVLAVASTIYITSSEKREKKLKEKNKQFSYKRLILSLTESIKGEIDHTIEFIANNNEIHEILKCFLPKQLKAKNWILNSQLSEGTQYDIILLEKSITAYNCLLKLLLENPQEKHRVREVIDQNNQVIRLTNIECLINYAKEIRKYSEQASITLLSELESHEKK